MTDPSSFNVLTGAKYISLVTYRRDGTPVATPIWFAAGATPGRFVAYTEAQAGKAKRIRATARITVQPCDMRGKVADGAPTFEGTGRIIEGAEAADAETRLAAKYGLMKKLFELGGSLASKVRRKSEKPTAYLELALG
jgi:uncharacterized protein